MCSHLFFYQYYAPFKILIPFFAPNIRVFFFVILFFQINIKIFSLIFRQLQKTLNFSLILLCIYQIYTLLLFHQVIKTTKI